MKTSDCLFCRRSKQKIIYEDEYCYVTRDSYPATELHTLIMPKRHVKDYFEMNQDELGSVHKILLLQREEIQKLDSTVEGFNIGMNCGAVAGQSVFHCHIHLMPRRKGDVENPQGGVRHAIYGKGHYKRVLKK
ncbi:MAG: HIT family protein [Gammaproteobacteria bacterium]|nr:HIT family protein [Gammaproteobacteria bacterium]